MTRILAPALALFLCSASMAQRPVPTDSIAPRLTGCWFAGDGGMTGEYCFHGDGRLVITPPGRARTVLERTWSVDDKGEVFVTDGRNKIQYVVEHLAADGFVLVNDRHHIRLEGHKDPPKRR